MAFKQSIRDNFFETVNGIKELLNTAIHLLEEIPNDDFRFSTFQGRLQTITKLFLPYHVLLGSESGCIIMSVTTKAECIRALGGEPNYRLFLSKANFDGFISSGYNPVNDLSRLNRNLESLISDITKHLEKRKKLRPLNHSVQNSVDVLTRFSIPIVPVIRDPERDRFISAIEQKLTRLDNIERQLSSNEYGISDTLERYIQEIDLMGQSILRLGGNHYLDQTDLLLSRIEEVRELIREKQQAIFGRSNDRSDYIGTGDSLNKASQIELSLEKRKATSLIAKFFLKIGNPSSTGNLDVSRSSADGNVYYNALRPILNFLRNTLEGSDWINHNKFSWSQIVEIFRTNCVYPTHGVLTRLLQAMSEFDSTGDIVFNLELLPEVIQVFRIKNAGYENHLRQLEYKINTALKIVKDRGSIK